MPNPDQEKRYGTAKLRELLEAERQRTADWQAKHAALAALNAQTLLRQTAAENLLRRAKESLWHILGGRELRDEIDGFLQSAGQPPNGPDFVALLRETTPWLRPTEDSPPVCVSIYDRASSALASVTHDNPDLCDCNYPKFHSTDCPALKG